MRIEQKFEKSDLAEVKPIFEKSMEFKSPFLRKNRTVIKIWKCSLFALAVILFGCSIILAALNGFSNKIIIYSSVVIVALLTAFILNRIDKKTNAADVIQQKYGDPFEIILGENALTYRQNDFLYTEIRFVIEYKNFLFIKANNRWLVIKVNNEEKEAILSKMNEQIAIHFVKKEEPFDLREFR